MSIRKQVEAWTGTDADLLADLNTPTIQIDDYHPNKEKWLSLEEGERQLRGMHSNATFAARLGQSALGRFLSLLRGAINQYKAAGDAESLGTAEVLEGFLNRFNTTIYGLDFREAEIRASIVNLYKTIGADPQPVINLGFKLISRAQQELGGRPATQEDVDAVRAEIKAEEETQRYQQLQTDYDRLFNEHVATPMFAGDKTATIAGLRKLADAWEAE